MRKKNIFLKIYIKIKLTSNMVVGDDNMRVIMDVLSNKAISLVNG